MVTTMRSFSGVCLLLVVLGRATAFQSSFVGSFVTTTPHEGKHSLVMEYVPSGMTKEEYRKVKEAERKKLQGKNLGHVGITSFKSRSLQDWQKAGGKNLFPVDPSKIKNPKDLPYMMRPGGAADDADLKKRSPFGVNKKKPKQAEEKKETNWWTLN